VSLTPTRVRYSFLSTLASVYFGKDIRTGAEIALKIGWSDHSSPRLRHEYNVYTQIAGGAGISPVHWYGKEGPYEVIVMNHLGTSLGDLISGGQVDHGKIFQYAPQMVCSSLNKNILLNSYMHSSQQLSRNILGTMSIVTSSRQTSWFDSITFTQLSSSSTSAWHNYSAIPQHIYTTQTPQISLLSVLFHSHLSLAIEDLLSCIVTTWSLLSTPSFIQHVVTCLGRPFPLTVLTVIRRRSSRRRSQSQ
jgi:hypothetical protein